MVTRPRSGPRHPLGKKRVRRRRCKLATCNQLFAPIRPNQRFCSKQHKQEFHFKTESFQRTKAEVLKLVDATVEHQVERLSERIARKVFLALETSPPPALVERIAARIADMIRAGSVPLPVTALAGLDSRA